METDVSVMVNSPKKAIRNLSIPLIITNLLLILNTIVDGIWITGLGVDALTAIGFVSPLTILIIGFGNGLSSGVNSLIARCIGAEEYGKASNAAIHSVVLGVIASVVVTIILLIFLKQILLFFGGASVIDLAMDYAVIYVSGLFTIFISFILSAIFKVQGDIKKATSPFIFSTIINMIIDPLFILILNGGMAGAAYATVLSSGIAMVMLIYWLIIKKDNFLEISLSEYKTNFKIYKDILVVGIPASLEQVSISISTIIINFWLLLLGTTSDVAVYNVVWRIMGIATVCVVAVSVASSTVAGVAYGGKNYENLKTTLYYGIKLSFIIVIILSIIMVIFSNELAFIFSYSDSTVGLNDTISFVIRLLTLYVIASPLGGVSTLVFQGMGKGSTSLAFIMIRTLVLELFFIYLFTFILNWGVLGIYVGLVIGMAAGSLVAFGYLEYYLKKHKDYFDG